MTGNYDWGIDPVLKIERISERATIPTRATSGSACWDIYACLESGQSVKYFDDRISMEQKEYPVDGILSLKAGCRYMIPTGIKLGIPYEHSVKIYPRSGLSIKKGLCLANGVGVIDSDYRNELMVLLINLGPDASISDGERIAQMELTKVEYFIMKEVSLIDESGTRTGGFGSTGEK